MRRTRAAFTLIELLVVIAIIGTLIGLLLPAIQKTRDLANRLVCAHNLKQIGIACHNYHDVHQALPPGYTSAMPYTDGASDTAPGWGWAAYLLPFVEQEPLHRQLDFSQPVPNSPAVATVVRLYLCPGDVLPPSAITLTDVLGNPVAVAAPCSYSATVGEDADDTAAPTGSGIFYRNSATRLTDIFDGTSQTVMAGDRSLTQALGIWAGAPSGALLRAGKLNPWTSATAPAPTLVLVHNNFINILTDADGGLDDFSSMHYGGANLLFADGSVHFIASITGDDARRHAFWAMGTRAGNDLVGAIDY
jgi:prepilin-type N-terminal cleavage/methylation domain-containing protein/prepilin-type processing-associated H-X9-DG protein